MQPRCALALLLLLLCTSSVSSQLVAEHMTAQVPDWNSAHSIGILLLLCVTLPCFIVVLVLLYKRRGFFFLCVKAVTTIVSAVLLTIIYLVYPHGMPCGMHSACLFLWFPYNVAMVVRAWILGFKLELTSFLEELGSNSRVRSAAIH
jgi:hypothetical protein